jgi:hypothetical protein
MESEGVGVILRALRYVLFNMGFYGSGETSNLSTRRMAQFYRGGLKPYNFSTSYSTVVQYYENIIIYSCQIKKMGHIKVKIKPEDINRKLFYITGELQVVHYKKNGQIGQYTIPTYQRPTSQSP